ncbi:hypothetical protein ACX9I7_22845, partial [Streptomyces sp. L500]
SVFRSSRFSIEAVGLDFRFQRPVGAGFPSLSESFRPIYIGFSVPDKDSEALRVNPIFPIHSPKLGRY